MTQFKLFEQTDNWGDNGEQHVKISLCRCLLKIGPEEPISYEQATEFLDKIKKDCDEHGLTGKTNDSLLHSLKHYTFQIFKTTYANNKIDTIAELLKFIESKFTLVTNFYNEYRVYILATYSHKTIGSYSVYHLKNEVLRSPSYPMANAALYRLHNIHVREISFKTILNQKWYAMFEDDSYLSHKISTDDFWNISHGIKELTLAKYEIDSKDALMEKESVFLNDMYETITYHEIGHAGIVKEIFPDKNNAAGVAAQKFGFDIYEALFEVFADFTPFCNNLFGPFYNMVAISKKDKMRAERMFYMYLSDVWFYDTDDIFMYTYSDIVCMLMLRYIKADRSIRFNQMEKDLTFRSPTPTDKSASLFEKLYHLFNTDTQTIIELIENATYTVKDTPYNYAFFRSVYINNAKQKNPNIEIDTYNFLTPYYTNFISYLKHYSPETFKKLDRYLNNKKAIVLKKILILSAGKKVAESFHYDHRNYIKEAFKKRGIISKQHELNLTK